MNILLAQARFPAPEFENYTVPKMSLETSIPDTILLRVACLILFLGLSAFVFYRLRSRKGMVVLYLAGLAVFGFFFFACPCPVGMIQNIVAGAFGGETLSAGLLLLFALPLLFALFFGRVFCAGACPLGAIQELLQGNTLRVPAPLDRLLRQLPILILLLSIVCVAGGLDFPICRWDPYLPIFLRTFPFPFTFWTLGIVLFGFFISRPFCRYLCPYGALLRLFALLPWFRPKITVGKCVACRLCEQGCPNGAILIPEERTSEWGMKRGVRRLSLLIAFFPLALFAGGLTGYFAAPILASAHDDVRLSRQLRAGERTKEVEAFELSGLSVEEQEIRAADAENFLQISMTAAGIIFAGCLMLELIASARRRGEWNDYEIDASLCFCCGRCFRACPVEARGLEKESRND